MRAGSTPVAPRTPCRHRSAGAPRTGASAMPCARRPPPRDGHPHATHEVGDQVEQRRRQHRGAVRPVTPNNAADQARGRSPRRRTRLAPPERLEEALEVVDGAGGVRHVPQRHAGREQRRGPHQVQHARDLNTLHGSTWRTTGVTLRTRAVDRHRGTGAGRGASTSDGGHVRRRFGRGGSVGPDGGVGTVSRGCPAGGTGWRHDHGRRRGRRYAAGTRRRSAR